MKDLNSAFARLAGSDWERRLQQVPASRASALVLIVLMGLLGWGLARELFRGKEAGNRARPAARTAPVPLVPVELAAALQERSSLAGLVPPLDQPGAFHTTHFVPPPPGPTPPPPAPAATQKLEMVYQGFFETAGGERRAFVRIADKSIVAGPGMALAGGLSVAAVAHKTLTLTNVAGETAVLDFNTRKALEVPVQP
jgi:hypothetical protein